MRHTTNLRIAYTATTPVTAHQFETLACCRFRMLTLASFSSQEEVADYLGVPLRTISRWTTGATSLPAWALLKLEARAKELGFEICDQPKRAA